MTITFIKKYWYIVLIIGLFSCEQGDMFSKKEAEAHVLVKQGANIIQNDMDSSIVHLLPEISLGDTTWVNFTLTNQGSGILKIGNITVDNKLFTIVQPPVKELASGKTTTFKVSFTTPRFGEHRAHIGFFTNDAQNPTYRFQVRGSSTKELSLSLNPQTDTPQGLNTKTASTSSGSTMATLFVCSFELFDPFKEINENTKLVVHATFSDKTKKSLIRTGTGNKGFQINSSRTMLRYAFIAGFGLNTFIDLEVYLELENGKRTRTVKYRINRPKGAA